MGQYCATNDESTIQTGIETVKEILRKHYVHRNEAGLVRSTIKEKGRHKVIDRISVSLNDKDDVYEAEFANLGIKKVLIDSSTVKAHQKLLVGGVWCIADLEYDYTEDKSASPWVLASLKPIQISRFDFDGYLESRKQFTTDEWIDLLIQSIGFNPQMFGKRNKLLQLIRLIPFCERNYNLIELGPKGTGKSHVYSEFSPHGILISGGEVTVPKLFVHNGTGKLGLVGYWDVVAFDEFAGKQKRVDKALVDIMKNYMANKSFSRGVETLGAEASMVFVGNTDHTVPYMLKHSDLFDPLPEKFHDSAFLDRLHSYTAVQSEHATISLPDADKWWYSAGATYHIDESKSIDLGMAYINGEASGVKEGIHNNDPGQPFYFEGNNEGNAFLASVQFNMVF
ncbi:BREX system Lon protease-like protein BrxL [Aeromonas media]|uniref:BREX system Lon protease-like protein BrxL n=1 Tax=Aeromonas media TaxID=651 RepID=UPI0030DD856A